MLTAVMMGNEIAGGSFFGSMALVADGWHMSTHAAALSIAGFAYWFARKHAHDPRFTLEQRARSASWPDFRVAVILALVALFIGYESVQRILAPIAIGFEGRAYVEPLRWHVNSPVFTVPVHCH